MNKSVLKFVMISLVFGVGFGARPLMTDDCGTMPKGALGAEMGYDGNRTLAVVLKNSPKENVECSLAYSLPSGTAFSWDQAELGTKVAFIDPGDEGIGLTGITKYNNATKALTLTAVVSKTGKQYCIHANAGYVPSQALSLLVAVEYSANDALEIVGELARTNLDWAGLAGGRYHLNELITVDFGFTFPVTGGASASTGLIGLSVEI